MQLFLDILEPLTENESVRYVDATGKHHDLALGTEILKEVLSVSAQAELRTYGQEFLNVKKTLLVGPTAVIHFWHAMSISTQK